MSIIILHFEAVYGVDDFSVTEQSLPPVAREELALRGDTHIHTHTHTKKK